MDTIFRIILTSSLYASCAGIIILILKTVFKDKISPKWHYIIWMVLVLKLIIPFGPGSVLSLFNAVPQLPQETSFTQQYEEFHKSMNSMRQEKNHLPTTSQVKETSLSVAATAENCAPYIWGIGAVLMLGWLIFTNLSLNRKLRKGRSYIPESINSIFNGCKKRAGIQGNVEVVLQDTINTPAIFGISNPKILLPTAITVLGKKDISYILLHELAHYKRKDLFANYLLLLLQIIHWFNPVIWYCFRKIRQDMEVAADEMVLVQLDSSEQKEYGKALLAVLENFNLPRFAPRLIGMIDDGKNIRRRIKLIKMAELFKRKRKIAVVTGVLCILMLSGVLLTSALPKQSSDVNVPELTSLFKLKTPYVGSAYKVGTIINNLSFENLIAKDGFSLKTDKKPYGISIKFEPVNTGFNLQEVESVFRNNATLMFVLIDNVDEIDFSLLYGTRQQKHHYTRAQIQQSYHKDLREYARDEKSFASFFKDLSAKLPAPRQPKTIDEAVSLAIKAQWRSYAGGEAQTEGHIILDTEGKDGVIKAYTLSSYGGFGFENGIFTKISGTGSIPTVITFRKNQNSEYSLIGYKEPMDGAGYIDSIKKMFPEKLWNTVFKQDKHLDLTKQQENQARQYLKTIGRNAEVSGKHVNKKPVEMDVDALNKLFAEYTKNDAELNNFPDWIGTKEIIQNGVRYIYETSQSKTNDGYDLISFEKTRENGTVVKEYKYKIVGHEPQLLTQ